MIESAGRPSWLRKAGSWLGRAGVRESPPVRIGLALGGGFARGIVHVGVLRALERHGVRVSSIAGVSAGSIVAAAYASGASVDEIAAVAGGMRFRDVARWTLNRLGLADTARLEVLLKRLLKADRFERMQIPLAMVASDLITGQPEVFRGSGDVAIAIRASCAYPGLFLPVRHGGHCLVDGLVAMAVPAPPLRDMGATRVISVALPDPPSADPTSIFGVVTRCFQILAAHGEHEWRAASSLVITPPVADIAWDAFECCGELIEAGERAGEAAMPEISRWFGNEAPRNAKPVARVKVAPAPIAG